MRSGKVSPVSSAIKESDKLADKVAIALLPDHPTPCEIKTHTNDPVPFIIYHPDNEADEVIKYDEFSVNQGYYKTLKGNEFMKALLNIS